MDRTATNWRLQETHDGCNNWATGANHVSLSTEKINVGILTVDRRVRRADNLTTFICRLSWNQPPGTLWTSPGLQWDCFTFYCSGVSHDKLAVSRLVRKFSAFCGARRITRRLQEPTCLSRSSAIWTLSRSCYAIALYFLKVYFNKTLQLTPGSSGRFFFFKVTPSEPLMDLSFPCTCHTIVLHFFIVCQYTNEKYSEMRTVNITVRVCVCVCTHRWGTDLNHL
jgi:hypothetical protein